MPFSPVTQSDFGGPVFFCEVSGFVQASYLFQKRSRAAPSSHFFLPIQFFLFCPEKALLLLTRVLCPPPRSVEPFRGGNLFL